MPQTHANFDFSLHPFGFYHLFPTTGSTATPLQFVVPEGYLLLEYFGAHDFGWVKAESVTAMYTYSPSVDG